MSQIEESPKANRRKWVFAAIAITFAAVLPFITFESSLVARVVSITCVCLVLWLLELVPAFVPTLLLWILVPLFLSHLEPKYSLANTLRWAADPVLALFFGGFALGVATERHGVSKRLANWAVSKSGNSFPLFLVIVIAMTAFMSMWISNIAAAALMFAALRPVVSGLETDDRARRTLLIGTAFAANLGGMATPIGTGPNAIAIASTADSYPITFVDWMTFALPLTVGLLITAYALLYFSARNGTAAWQTHAASLTFDAPPRATRAVGLTAVLGGAVVMWLTEPVHGIPAAVVSIGAAAALFLSGLLRMNDLGRIDWSTLLLIAGGITLGKLLEASGIIHVAAASLTLGEMNPYLAIFILCFASALLSALMSNTATAVLLIPLAGALMPEPSTAILIAIAASFGMPFIISTPPNAMAHGEGGVRSSDLFYPGVVIMLIGCAVVSLTGRAVLNFAGIP
jgi:solute carrier family 13 (sodium-dependent dicarboxylate transporter), member 2/3/5